MKVLRLQIHQNFANYKKEESIINKMTYPLPPFSTVIGAIHSACGWKNYHEMDLCILGNWDTLNKRPYTDVAFFNSTMDDRGKLVKILNPLSFSNAYTLIASSKKQGSSFKKKKDIDIYNKELLDEWIKLKEQEVAITEEKKKILEPEEVKLKEIKKNIKTLEKGTEDFINQKEIETQQKKKIEELKLKFTNDIRKIQSELELYKTINTSIKYYETLSNINLIIYIKTSDSNIDEIINNINNFICIGRSEDSVEVIEAKIVDITVPTESITSSSLYNSYVDYNLIKNEHLYPDVSLIGTENSISHSTIYYISKDYTIENGIRKFNRKKVLYLNNITINDENLHPNIYVDNVNNEVLVINFN